MPKPPAGDVRSDRLELVVVVPTLNEAGHIERLSRHLLEDPVFAAPGAALWIVDGGSTDGTRDIVERLAAKDDRIQLVDNPQRTQAWAVNLAAEMAATAGATRLVRIDAHSHYPPRFISTLVGTLETEGCDSVVAPMRTIGGDPMRDAAADLYNSWLGNGGSPHRSGKVRGYVEHGHHAAFALTVFRRVGGYDTRFVANEDAELDKRIIKAGGRIFLENTLPIDYIPRGTVGGYWKQMWRNGRFRTWTAAKHRDRLGLRQLLPIGVALVLVASVVAGLFWLPALAPALGYLALVIALSVKSASRPDPLRVALIVVLAVVSHVAFGVGALFGLMETRFGQARSLGEA